MYSEQPLNVSSAICRSQYRHHRVDDIGERRNPDRIHHNRRGKSQDGQKRFNPAQGRVVVREAPMPSGSGAAQHYAAPSGVDRSRVHTPSGSNSPPLPFHHDVTHSIHSDVRWTSLKG